LIVIALVALAGWWFHRSNKEIEKKRQELVAYTNQQTTIGVEWKPEKKIMPLIADSNNILGTLRVASQQYAQLKVELEAEGITEKKTEILSIKPETVGLELGVPISSTGYEKLNDKSQSTKLRIKVSQIMPNEEKLLLSDEHDLFFNSIYEIVWKKDGKNNTQDVLKIVNKDDPSIVELIHNAAKYVAEFGGPKDAMLGYAAGDEKGARAQVEAIFKAMINDYQIRYIMSPFSYNGAEIQKLINPAQVLSTKSGICIDLSLLMTAAFENLGFEPVLVFTDSHVWPGIELGYNSGKFIFIESTALDKSPVEAVRIGAENWKLVQDKNVPITYDLIRVMDARSDGILPVINRK
jgi:hypothetical protein